MSRILLEVADETAAVYARSDARGRAAARMAFLRSLGPEAVRAERERLDREILDHQRANGVTDEESDRAFREIADES